MVVYQIKNLVNGKVYIGQTIQESNRRWSEHKVDAKYKKHPLYNSMRKYGLENFSFTVLDTATTLDDLNLKEEYYLNLAKANGKVYNLREAGTNKTHSEESKMRMSEAQKKAHARRRNNGGDGGWTRRDGGAMKGKKWDQNHRGRLSETIAKRKEWIENNKEAWRVSIKNGLNTKGKTWKLVDGKRVWMEKN